MNQSVAPIVTFLSAVGAGAVGAAWSKEQWWKAAVPPAVVYTSASVLATATALEPSKGLQIRKALPLVVRDPRTWLLLLGSLAGAGALKISTDDMEDDDRTDETRKLLGMVLLTVLPGLFVVVGKVAIPTFAPVISGQTVETTTAGDFLATHLTPQTN